MKAKKMKRKNMASAMIILTSVGIALAGCGTSNESSIETAASAVDTGPAAYGDIIDESYEEPLENQNETWEKAPNDAEIMEETVAEEEMIVTSYPLTELRPFSEGRAWVNFEDNGAVCTGIIDTAGKLLYRADGRYWYVSQFTDGFTIYRENETENSPCGIIDSDGNVMYTSQIRDDGGYLILGYGAGHFFAAQHIRNFDTDEWRCGTIDKNGNIMNEMVKQDYLYAERWLNWEDGSSYIRYIGENFIQLPMGLYNISTSDFSLFPRVSKGSHYCEAVSADFADGYTILVTQYFHPQSAIVIDINYARSGLDEPQGIYSRSHNSIAEGTEYSEGLIWGNENYIPGYYDKDWTLIISMEQYKENKITGGAFRGGYAAVTMTGADGELYASVIKNDGNLVYSPVKIDSANVNNAENGYFQVTIDGEEKIIAPDGTIYTPGADDLSVIKDASFGDIYEGFMILGNTYVHLEDKTIIDSAKMFSREGGVALGNGSVFNADNESEVSYIMPDDYRIEGTWKSIGESGFGQAQPGAVVVFDGARCNFFSPDDIYDFYNDGNGYVLNVASMLGDSLSFSVYIVNDNRIDIYYGSNVTELERVD